MKLLGFVFGIRVSKSFYLEDKMGAIIDELLYTKGSAFGPSLFPRVQEGTGAKMLYNQETDDKLTVTHSDFIFEYTVKKDFDSELKKYLETFRDLVTKQVFKNFGVHYIARFGFIVKAELDKNDALTNSVHEIIQKNYNGFTPDSYSLRFNVKEKRPLKIKDIITEDFDNTIVTYDKSNENNSLVLSVDYQKYFRPELNEISDSKISFEEFCKNSFKMYKKDYCESEKA